MDSDEHSKPALRDEDGLKEAQKIGSIMDRELGRQFRTYRLEGKNAVPCGLLEQATSRSDNWRVAFDTVGNIEISTVFLGSDHDWTRKGPPLLFETMLFLEGDSKGMGRCSTYDEAEQKHAAVVQRVRDFLAKLTPSLDDQEQIEDKSDD